MTEDLRAQTLATDPCAVLGGILEWDPAQPACGEPSAGVLRSVCVHEHVAESRPTCAACAVDLQQMGGAFICGPCSRGPSPHECLTRVTVEWYPEFCDPEPVTVVQGAA